MSTPLKTKSVLNSTWSCNKYIIQHISNRSHCCVTLIESLNKIAAGTYIIHFTWTNWNLAHFLQIWGSLCLFVHLDRVSRVFGHFFTLINMEILTWRMASTPTWEVINFYIVAKVAQILNKARNNWWFTLRQGLSINILRIKMTFNSFNSLLRIILIWFQNLHPSNPGHCDLQSSVPAWLVYYYPWGTREVFLCFTKSSHFSPAALVSVQNTCQECLKGVVGPRPVELALL